MQRVFWRYSGLKRSAMSRKPAVSWAFPALFFTAGRIDLNATVGMDCTRDAKGRVGDVLLVCRCRMSRRFWSWLCRTPPAGRVSTRCSLFATTTDICRPVPSIERCDAWGWAPDSSDSWSWNNTVPGGQACSQSVHDGSWHVPVVRGGTWKPRSRVSLSVWTPFTSVDSKGWVRSSRSQPVMRPARMPRHASSPPIPLSTPLVSLWTSSCPYWTT